MADPIQVLWTPAGRSMPSLGSRALVDTSDGDTPNIRMPIRMLSIDTPESKRTSSLPKGDVDEHFSELADWIASGNAPISSDFAQYIHPKLTRDKSGSNQYLQGKAAGEWFKERLQIRLTKPNGKSKRQLFLRAGEDPFDNYNRVLAYVAPSYSKEERREMSRKEKATFNLDLIESGWALPFLIFPNLPGELDMPLVLRAAELARIEQRGQYQDPLHLAGWEYRMMEKLARIMVNLKSGKKLSFPEKISWRSRYAADMRDRSLKGPEGYFTIPVEYRIWIWPEDVQQAIAMLNLVPDSDLVT